MRSNKYQLATRNVNQQRYRDNWWRVFLLEITIHYDAFLLELIIKNVLFILVSVHIFRHMAIIPWRNETLTGYPFGLKTAPSLFQKSMTRIFEPILSSALSVYVMASHLLAEYEIFCDKKSWWDQCYIFIENVGLCSEIV